MLEVINKEYFKICDDCGVRRKITRTTYKNNINKEIHLCMSCNKTGDRNPFFGKTHSDEFKKRQSINLTNRLTGKESFKKGCRISDEHKQKIINSTKGKINIGSNNGMYGKKGKLHPMYGKNPYANKTKNEIKQILAKQANTRFLNNTNVIPKRFSKISQSLFWKLYEKFQRDNSICFGELNYELAINANGRNYFYDFCYKNKIIEFNGDNFHANPAKFKFNDMPHPFRKSTPSYIIWEEDNIKLEVAKNNNYEVLIVWENDYLNNKLKLEKEIINFLQK